MRRIITGLILGGGWLLLLWYGTVFMFWAVVMVAGCIALSEYFRMTLRNREKKYLVWTVLIGLIPLAVAVAGRADIVGAAVFGSLLLLVAFILIVFPALTDSFDFMVRLCFGVIYIGFCLAHLILVRMQPQGVFWLLVLSAVTVGSDSGAYYIGRWLGRKKLLPAVSPGKTRAGAVGGLVSGVLAAILTAALLFTKVDFLKLAAAAILLTGIGMAGDLAESVIKRSVGVKDSGNWLAGHGGLLDRGDSLLLAAPALYYLLHFGLLAGQ